MNSAETITVQMVAKLAPFDQPARYKVAYGGRGAAKSWDIARRLILRAAQRPLRILCGREFQNSISDSVHKLLSDQIENLGLEHCFRITERSILCLLTGSEFIFKGLHANKKAIKSLEAIDIAWIEEAETVSAESWDILVPTIRKEDSEIWISFNTGTKDDPTYKRFVLSPPPDSIVIKVGWEDNPFFPETLRKEMEHCRRTDPDAYAHIWGGEPLTLTDACIFKGRYRVEPFETPADARFFHGADWGFSQDPTVLIRAFVKDDCLYIDQEAYGVGVELDETPQLFNFIPTAKSWPIKADCARPETISHVRRKGFNIAPAKKWAGSVEDGLACLKGFTGGIVIHERCKHMADEARLYSYKVDRQTGEILPIIVDAHNHCWDALRYALDGYIKGRAPMVISPDVLTKRGAH